MANKNIVSPEIANQIDFNFHLVASALAVDIPDSAAAAMLHITLEQFTGYADMVTAELQKVAQTLLKRPGLADAVRKLKMRHSTPVSNIMMVGDSITSYRYGHAELLRAMLGQVDPQVGFELRNMGRSGYTSTHGLEHTFSQYLPAQPDWVFIKYGVNDCKRFGSTKAKALVSLDEYKANINTIVEAFVKRSRAQIVLLTPTPVLEEVVNNNPDFAIQQIIWQNSDIQAYADAMRQVATQHKITLVDLFGAFTATPDPHLLLPDGLHPSPLGQQLMVEQVLRSVSNIA